MDRFLLTGKKAIVSGASYGMGKEMARILAQEGASVLMTARGEERLKEACEELKAEGLDVIWKTTNVADPNECREVFAYAIEQFGQIDIVVNNAAKGGMETIEASWDELIDETVDINLKGPIYYCREAVKHMLPRKTGSIINISSVNGIRPVCGASYCSSKGGVNTLTQGVALRLVGTGVRCNAVAPGLTITPMSNSHEVDPRQTLEDGVMNPIRNTRTVRTVPTHPLDQAKVVLFLASDLSSAVNGELITVDNGSYL